MLDDRKTAILRAVVEEYIATAQPVGSSHIAASHGVQVSSATVRNDMAFLEQEGYLAQPHTSAGRIPTDKGYRFFVDHLTPNGKLGAADQMKVGEFFDTATGRLEETLQRTSTLLAQMTNYAAVVLGPKKEIAVVRSVQLVGLSAHLATAVVVLSNGAVESEPIELASTISEDEMQRTTAHLSRLMVGKALGDMVVTAATGDVTIDALAMQVLAAMSGRRTDESVFVGGASAMAEAFDAVEIVRSVLHTLEQQFVMVSLVRDMLNRGLSVAIGAEHGVEPLVACSVVLGPKKEVAVVRSVQLVGLSAHLATAVVVLSNGAVESEPIELASTISEDEMQRTTAHLSRLMVGKALGDMVVTAATGDVTIDALAMQVLAAMSGRRTDESVFVGGASAMAEAFDAVEIVRSVLHTLEQQFVMVSLVRDMLNRGLSVAIGAEHGVEPLVACSVVLAPVIADGTTLGTVGILGPTRMNYPQALATVEVVSDRLGRRLADS